MIKTDRTETPPEYCGSEFAERRLGQRLVSSFFGGSERKQFLSHVSATFIVRVILIGAGVATSVMTARLLGPAGRGAFIAAMVLGAMGSQFGNLGLHSANTYYVGKDRSLLPRLLSNALAISVVVGGCISLGLWLVFTNIPKWAPAHNGLLAGALLLIPTLLAQLLLQNLLLGIQEVKWYNFTELLSRISFIALLTGMWLTGRGIDPTAVLMMALIGNVITVLSAVSRLLYQAGGLHWPSLSLLRMEAGYGLRSYIICLAGYMVLKSDILMVKYLAGDSATGLYSLASSMTDLVYTFPSVVGMILFPMLSTTGGIDAKWRRARKTAVGIAAIMAGIAIVAGALATPLTRIAYGSRFLPAVPAFLILCVAIVFYGANSVISIFFSSCGQPWLSVWIWPAGAVFNIVVNLVAIPRLGIVGAALSSLATYSLLLLVQYSLAARYVRRGRTTVAA